MGFMLHLVLTFYAAFLELASAYPSNSSTNLGLLSKRAVSVISNDFTAAQKVQITQGFTDACALAQAGWNVVEDQVTKRLANENNYIYAKYFPTGTNDADGSHLNNVRTVFGNLIRGTITDTCSTHLSDFTIRADFLNLDTGKMSCMNSGVMASTRNGGDKATVPPIMVLCDPALEHGNIGPTVVDGAPAPVTCHTVNAGEGRTTYRMDTLGATILHEYTHYSVLVEAAVPGGTKDFLDGDDDPSLTERYGFYGVLQVQESIIVNRFGPQIADSYTWFAIEALWSKKCNVQYAGPHQGDDEDPLFDSGPGEDPDSETDDEDTDAAGESGKVKRWIRWIRS